MDASPAVSVISPAYNHSAYIGACIESVLAQTYGDWEMLIVDDGSTDDTLAVAREYAARDPRIRVFTQPNVGIFRLGETYNFALGQARGKYIAVLECDDVWLPEKLERQVGALEEDAGAVLSWGRAYEADRELKTRFRLLPEGEVRPEVFRNDPPLSILREFFFTLFIPALTLVIRREALVSLGGFRQGYGLPLVDVPTCLALAARGRFLFVDEPLGCWRTNPGQITKTRIVEMHEGFRALALDFYREHRSPALEEILPYRRLKRHYREQAVVAYSRSGRYKLIRRDFKGARQDYLRSLFGFGLRKPVWKLRSLAGYVCSLFGRDVEGLARLTGRRSYS